MVYYSWEHAGQLTDRTRPVWKYSPSSDVPLEVSFREGMELCTTGNTLVVYGVAITMFAPSTWTAYRSPVWISEPCTYVGQGTYKIIDSSRTPVPSIKTQEDLYTLLNSYRGGRHEETVR